MKKQFLTFAMLASVAASATVTVTPISTDYSTKKVTFKVAWANSPTAPYNNRVWIWIDFCPISGVTPQSFSTATITSPVKTGGNGTITNATARGFFIEYNTTNAGTTVTATLSNAPTGKFNWCVYGSDYPPNVLANTNGSYTLAGTPPFTLIASNGTTMQPVNGTTIATAAVTMTPATITDATGYPGLWCPYTGNDLYMNATHRCRQRQSGAYNWEAWIKDVRDDELYRIVLMPDDKWWLAQNVKLASYSGSTVGAALSDCTKDECGRSYTNAESHGAWGGTNGQGANIQGVCPSGWVLPVNAEWRALINAIEPTVTWTTYTEPSASGVYTINASLIKKLIRPDAYCYVGEDLYGWATVKETKTNAAWRDGMLGWWSGQENQYANYYFLNHRPGSWDDCGYISAAYHNTSRPSERSHVRCIRQL